MTKAAKETRLKRTVRKILKQRNALRSKIAVDEMVEVLKVDRKVYEKVCEDLSTAWSEIHANEKITGELQGLLDASMKNLEATREELKRAFVVIAGLQTEVESLKSAKKELEAVVASNEVRRLQKRLQEAHEEVKRKGQEIQALKKTGKQRLEIVR